MKCLSVCLLLICSTVCHAQRAARIESRDFYNPDRGVKQLIRSLESENRAFFTLEPKKQDAAFDRIASVCINDSKHKTDPLCRAIDDISLALERYAKDREIVLLIDVSYGNVTTLYGQLNLSEAEDITQQFVNEYNRRHP
jgi:capsule polysaccharide export protein KpsC/LpsZ